MSKHVGVNNVVRKMTKEWIGVNNVARLASKAYIGVANVARKYYEAITKYSITSSNYTTYFTVSNPQSYTFTASGSNFNAANLGRNNTTAGIRLYPKESKNWTITLDYTVVSESNDKFYLRTVNSSGSNLTTYLNGVSGNKSGSLTISGTAGQGIYAYYTKNRTTHASGETARIYNLVLQYTS